MPLANFSSILELRKHQTQTQIYTILGDLLNFGLAAEVLAAPSPELKKEARLRLASHLILEVLLPQVNLTAAAWINWLSLLASRVGAETSLADLSSPGGLSAGQAHECLKILEATGLVYRLFRHPPQLAAAQDRSFTVYFADNGLWLAAGAGLEQPGAALFNPQPRQQWANFVFAERMKKQAQQQSAPSRGCWHTPEGFHLDYLEQQGPEVSGYSFGFEAAMLPSIQAFNARFPGAFFMTVTIKNFWGFVA